LPSFVPPKKGVAYTFYVSLVSQADTKVFQANPTIAAGDVKVATDDGAPANLTTLPVVDADFPKRVKVDLSATEMNGDNVTTIFSDAAGAEWCDLTINLQPSARQIDDLAFPTTSGRSLTIETDGMAHADVKEWLGVAPNALVTGRVDASVGAVAANAITAAGIADGAIDRATLAADTGLQTIRSNTAAAGAVGSITLDAGASAADDFYNDLIVLLTGGTGVGQARLISDYVGATKVASVVPDWVTAPDATTTFALLPQGRVDVGQWVDAVPNALVTGRVDASVGAMAANVVTAAAIATDAIGSDEFAQAAADKVWTSATRTLTAFSTALAVSVWDVLEAAIAVASSIGLKVKNNLDAAITSRATPAQVNAEVVDALSVDTYAEPGQSAPGATISLAAKIGFLFKAWRNRTTQTNSQYSLYGDDALTVDQKATFSDDGTTADRGEVASGP